jgi:hypothetical protein
MVWVGHWLEKELPLEDGRLLGGCLPEVTDALSMKKIPQQQLEQNGFDEPWNLRRLWSWSRSQSCPVRAAQGHLFLSILRPKLIRDPNVIIRGWVRRLCCHEEAVWQAI